MGPKLRRTMIAAFALASLPSSIAGAQSFYAGKTITLQTHGVPGDGYDSYLRLMQRYMGHHIAG